MSHTATSQIHEIGVLTGGSNYIGDIGSTNYIAPRTMALGVLYKWNKSKRYSYRASIMYARIEGGGLKVRYSGKTGTKLHL